MAQGTLQPVAIPLLAAVQPWLASGDPLLLSSWDHFKSFTSAVASWVKVFTGALPGREPGEVPAGQQQQSTKLKPGGSALEGQQQQSTNLKPGGSALKGQQQQRTNLKPEGSALEGQQQQSTNLKPGGSALEGQQQQSTKLKTARSALQGQQQQSTNLKPGGSALEGQQQQSTKLKPVDAGHALEWMLQKMGLIMGAAVVADSMGKLQTLVALDTVVMLWMARAVAATARQLLGVSAPLRSVRRKDGAKDGGRRSSRSSGGGSGVCSSSSSGRSMITGSSGSARVATRSSKGGREDNMGSSSSSGGKQDNLGSSSSGDKEDNIGSSSSKGGKEDSAGSSSTTSSSRVVDSRDLYGEDNSIDGAGNVLRHPGIAPLQLSGFPCYQWRVSSLQAWVTCSGLLMQLHQPAQRIHLQQQGARVGLRGRQALAGLLQGVPLQLTSVLQSTWQCCPSKACLQLWCCSWIVLEIGGLVRFCLGCSWGRVSRIRCCRMPCCWRNCC